MKNKLWNQYRSLKWDSIVGSFILQFIIPSPRAKRRTLQRQQNVPPNLKSAKAIMTKAAQQGRRNRSRIPNFPEILGYRVWTAAVAKWHQMF